MLQIRNILSLFIIIFGNISSISQINTSLESSFSKKGDFSINSIGINKDNILIASFCNKKKSLYIFYENGKLKNNIYLGYSNIDEIEFVPKTNQVILLQDAKNRITIVDYEDESIQLKNILIRDQWYSMYSAGYQDLYEADMYYLLPKYINKHQLDIQSSILSAQSDCLINAKDLKDSIYCERGNDLYKLNFWENQDDFYFSSFHVLYKKDNTYTPERGGIDTLWYIGNDFFPDSKVIYFEPDKGDLLYTKYQGYNHVLSYRNIIQNKKEDLNYLEKNNERKIGGDYYYRYILNENILCLAFVRKGELFFKKIKIKFD